LEKSYKYTFYSRSFPKNAVSRSLAETLPLNQSRLAVVIAAHHRCPTEIKSWKVKKQHKYFEQFEWTHNRS